MLFNSLDFAVFMPIVFMIYWALSKNVKIQNVFLLAASYFFYAWWDWRYLSLILVCSLTNYSAGLLMMKYDNAKIRKIVLIVCCTVCFGILAVFKYYDFFVTSFVDAFSLMGMQMQAHTLKLILPVGISFYTFHTLSYTIDVYRQHFEPTKDVVSFFLFVSIFPLAMAGPIERATNLLPQIYKKRAFDYTQATDGMRQILWGLFKKVVIANNCASSVNQIFANYDVMPASTLVVGAVLFAFQIYGDFSGYSDMAIGIGKLLGFKFLNNFRFPYFSRDIAEFWRRWHISLNTWFRDYLYIPLGGSRVSKAKVVRNTFVIFLVSGFWHGANWTFIVWGAFHALLFLPEILSGKNRKFTNNVAENRILPTITEFLQMGVTFLLVVVGWIFFRAETIGQAFDYISRIASTSLFTIPTGMKAVALSIPFMIVEWLGRNNQYAIEKIPVKSRPLRWAIYLSIYLSIYRFIRWQVERFYLFSVLNFKCNESVFKKSNTIFLNFKCYDVLDLCFWHFYAYNTKGKKQLSYG
ncbi:MAG: MBOAT family protein [Prevotellaceae bacterium]|jgi:D-alanyl-lipoteichoic acid acyltransferase DltB (MBOAT superfamily)|nr:MBOAT family protein [Prevotellaceae bacterium]